jgi:CheY-like chemotaxis protein
MAVDRVMAEGARFDAILMDVRMPEMDGIAATKGIRAVYPADALPIIAVTAHAFDDERDACLAAGMNDFVTKPVEPARLLTALARCIPERVTFVPTTLPPHMMPLPAAIPGFDIAATLGRFCGNASAVQRLLVTFSVRCAKAGATLQDAVTEGRLDDARAWVHGFRGAAATLGATTLTTRAARLEAALKEDDHAVVPEEMAALTHEMEQAATALRAHGFQ